MAYEADNMTYEVPRPKTFTSLYMRKTPCLDRHCEAVESLNGSRLTFHACHYMYQKCAHRCCEYTVELQPEIMASRKCAIVGVALAIIAYFQQLACAYAVLIAVGLTAYFLKVATTVVKESVLVELELIGIQQTKTYFFGGESSEVIQKQDILDVVINEAITMNEVVFYLGIIMKDQSVKPLFTDMMPRLSCLKIIYKEIQEMLLMERISR